MQKHNFNSISEFKGASLPYFTTHTDLVHRQRAAVEAKKVKVSSITQTDGLVFLHMLKC